MNDGLNQSKRKSKCWQQAQWTHDIWPTFWDNNIILHPIESNWIGSDGITFVLVCIWPLRTIILIRSLSLEINKILQWTIFGALCIACALIGILLLYDASNSNLKRTMQYKSPSCAPHIARSFNCVEQLPCEWTQTRAHCIRCLQLTHTRLPYCNDIKNEHFWSLFCKCIYGGE